MFYFYIFRCSDNSLYCGQTNGLERRVEEYNIDDKKSSKYTHRRQTVIGLPRNENAWSYGVYFEKFKTTGEAMKREWEVKKWKKEKKEAMINK